MQISHKKRWVILTSIILLVALIIVFFYPIRSYLVMGAYSMYNNKTSVMKEQSFKLDMPGGNSTNKKDWYPFVNIYDTSYEFSRFINHDVSLTVLYNFGAFKGKSSSLYDEQSKYFGAFYGAYVIHDNEEPDLTYGFNDEEIDFNQIVAVPQFDYQYLVIEDLGCNNLIFDILSYDAVYDTAYIGFDDWVKIDAIMLSNSPSHSYQEKKLGYIQYGLPLTNDKPDFFEIKLYGRMYARYFKEYKSTIVIYVMGADKEMINECDKELLQKTTIKQK